jgi:hypothetical protein
MTQIALLVSAGLDFLEISGGTYEDPQMMGYPNPTKTSSSPNANGNGNAKSARTAAREAFFLEFAHTVRERHPELVLMLTGGFRTRAGAEAAINDGACDLVGIARPAAVDPKFPLLLLDEEVPDEKAVLLLEKAPVPWFAKWLPRNLIGAGADSVSFDIDRDLGLSWENGCTDFFAWFRRIMLVRFSGWRRGWRLMRLLFDVGLRFGERHGCIGWDGLFDVDGLL